MSEALKGGMGNLTPLMTSKRQDWETPPDLFAELDDRFGPLVLDVAALPETAKCPAYFTPDDDGLDRPWHGRCWMNPPYGREIAAWVEKAHREAQAGRATVVALLPARTDTRWWHEHVMKADVIEFIRGRVYFHMNGQPNDRAPFPSAVVVWRAA